MASINCVYECEVCGITVSTYRSPSAVRPRFCSLQCLGKSQRGVNNPAYNGGRYKDSNGYIHIFLPDHPHVDCRGYIYEHRVVAEEKIGRLLTRKETVHHINHKRSDNRPENIEVCMNNGEHIRHHHWPKNTNPRQGDSHPQAKLTLTQVQMIRQRYILGEQNCQLAKAFAVSRSTISNIILRRIWNYD